MSADPPPPSSQTHEQRVTELRQALEAMEPVETTGDLADLPQYYDSVQELRQARQLLQVLGNMGWGGAWRVQGAEADLRVWGPGTGLGCFGGSGRAGTGPLRGLQGGRDKPLGRL